MLKINGEIFGDEEFRNKEAVYKKPKLNTDINTITLLFENNKDIANLAIAHSYLNIHAPEQKNFCLCPIFHIAEWIEK
jgi:ribose-phosphate pyrophosphokinase